MIVENNWTRGYTSSRCIFCKMSVNEAQPGFGIDMLRGTYHLECQETYENIKHYQIFWWPSYQVINAIDEA